MRFVVLGAGAVGGVVGARLAQHGHSVILIARGRHFEAIRDHGLRLESPDEVVNLGLPVVDHPNRIAWKDGDVVLLATKSQDSSSALDGLASAAPSNTPIVCIQNGVANERMALRRFPHVYGVCVYCATGHLTPGTVQAWFTPVTGVLDVGRYPSGVDGLTETTAAAFRRATFQAEPRVDIMRWKYHKLLTNLGNALEALCGPAARGSAIAAEARREAVACLDAAAIAFVSDEEARVRRLDLGGPGEIDGRKRSGGSTWQSLARGAGSLEADYLNGEIVLLGRERGIPTPVNELLQRLARQAARDGTSPGSVPLEDLVSML
jgi:2-dehydropantoate 2-reductase